MSTILPQLLAEALQGQRYLIHQLRGGKDFVSRMTAVGFTEGAEIMVIQNFGSGPLLTLVRGVRVDLGRGEALKVMVLNLTHEQ